MTRVVYDAGPLIAAERGDRDFWSEHLHRLEQGIVPIVPAPVVAQVSRSGKQAQLRRLLRGCDIVALDEEGAHRIGALLGKARTTDLADAAVVALAMARKADIVTSDRTDIERLVSAARSHVRVVDT